MNIDFYILVFRKANRLLIIGVYVNKLILITNQQKIIKQIKEQLFNEFNMKNLGKIKVIIEQKSTRDLQVKILKIDQKTYIQDLLKTKNMSSCYLTIFLIKTVSTIPINQISNNIVIDLTLFQHLVGRLMYLPYDIRSDITFIVGQLNRYNSKPRIRYL